MGRDRAIPSIKAVTRGQHFAFASSKFICRSFGAYGMRAVDEWKPSKFVLKNGHLLPSDDPSELGIGSRVVAECMAAQYQLALQKYARGKLLDLGCGKVPLYGVYRDLVDEAICVDWQSGLHGSKHVDFFRDLNKDLDLPANSFDTVILSDVLEHIRKPE